MSLSAASTAPRAGILCMVAGTCLLTMSDAILKWLSAGFPVGMVAEHQFTAS